MECLSFDLSGTPYGVCLDKPKPNLERVKTMTTETFELKLTYSQIRMLKEMVANDMEMSTWGMDAPDYEDIDTMEYYLNRAVVYRTIRDLLKSSTNT
jgi:hypothetical protein